MSDINTELINKLHFIFTMISVLQQFIESLEIDYSNKKNIFKSLQKKNLIVSYLREVDLDIDAFNIDFLLRSFPRSFYFEKPSENFKIIALGELFYLSENGRHRFDSLSKRIKEIKENFISNWTEDEDKFIPLYVGGMKFLNENEGKDWKDFDDASWFIPQILILVRDNKHYLIYNYYYSTPDKIKANLENKCIIIEKALHTDPVLHPVISNINGNSPKEKKKWKQNVSSIIDNILDKQVNKVVLSRRIEICLNSEVNYNFVLSKLKKKYNDCTIFIFKNLSSFFFGATPELLAKIENQSIYVDALAGSAPRGVNAIEDVKLGNDLLQDEKNLNEHKFVVEHIKNTLSKYITEIEQDENSSLRKLDNIQHLYTGIKGKLNCQNIIFRLLQDLYPTPAICGNPKENALSIIKKLEDYSRGMYSGIIGWFNYEDSGEFYVAIRSALSVKNKINAFAGCGIVEDSVPEDEFKESELKLQPILQIFNND